MNSLKSHHSPLIFHYLFPSLFFDSSPESIKRYLYAAKSGQIAKSSPAAIIQANRKSRIARESSRARSRFRQAYVYTYVGGGDRLPRAHAREACTVYIRCMCVGTYGPLRLCLEKERCGWVVAKFRRGEGARLYGGDGYSF